jgi:CHAD domain-containing protein
MLNRKEQLKFIHKRRDNILHHLTAFGRERDAESLHQLRVEVKKLKGFLALSAHCTGKRKLTGEAKQVFRQAGTIRTAQLNLEFIKQYGLKDARFKREQEAIVIDQSQEFCASVKDSAKVIRKNIKAVAHKIKAMHNKCIEDWYKKSLRNLKTVFVAFDPAELHEGRKVIKNLLHVHSLLNRSLVDSLKLNVEYFEQLQEVVGKWHDVAASYEMLMREKSKNKKVIAIFEKEMGTSLSEVKKLAVDFGTMSRLKAAKKKS